MATCLTIEYTGLRTPTGRLHKRRDLPEYSRVCQGVWKLLSPSYTGLPNPNIPDHDGVRLVIRRRDFAQLCHLGSNVGVDHRGTDIIMAKQFLHRPDVIAVFEQMRCKRMAQRVDRLPPTPHERVPTVQKFQSFQRI